MDWITQKQRRYEPTKSRASACELEASEDGAYSDFNAALSEQTSPGNELDTEKADSEIVWPLKK